MWQAEARLAAKRAARAEARDIRMRELERQQKEVLIQLHLKQNFDYLNFSTEYQNNKNWLCHYLTCCISLGTLKAYKIFF